MRDDSIATPADTPETLPTEPGWYLDRDGDIWRIDGSKSRAVEPGYENLVASDFVPFKRLRPVDQSSATDRVRRFLETNYPCGCEGDDECPGEANEAALIVRMVLGIEDGAA